VTAGPDAGQVRAIDDQLVVGSSETCGLQLHDATVSRQHLSLELCEAGVRFEDLGSTNGTQIGAARVPSGVLTASGALTVGNTTLEVLLHHQDVGLGEFTAERFGDAVGRSAAMRRCFAVLQKVAATESTVVLAGETGTGKDVLARALHAASPRRAGPFVVFDCAAVAPALIESELFGHVKGAFSDAHSDRKGAFQAAQGGTLFLDELGELPLELQPKLLRALENRTVRRVGDDRSRPVDVRVVAATHRDLEAEVAAGHFRQDLYFRLAVVLVRVPPLRERLEDLPLLIPALLQGRKVSFSPALLERLAAARWPGNVRELKNVLERVLASGEAAFDGRSQDPAVEDEPFVEARNRRLDAFTREYLARVLERHHHSVTEAARVSGISRATVYRLIKRFGLRGEE